MVEEGRGVKTGHSKGGMKEKKVKVGSKLSFTERKSSFRAWDVSEESRPAKRRVLQKKGRLRGRKGLRKKLGVEKRLEGEHEKHEEGK